ncbi:hypothetical protein BDR04DRAFT_949685, partial [Suillus decipiens]
MIIQSTTSSHKLAVTLPRTIRSEMITIYAKKGDRLDIIASAWQLESNCHYQWQVDFAQGDVDMSSIHARFEYDGKLS